MTDEDAKKHRQKVAMEKAKREAEARKDRSMTVTELDMTALARTAATTDEDPKRHEYAPAEALHICTGLCDIIRLQNTFHAIVSM